ncbi:MAG: ATP-binding cassette domain-containing protein [Microbacterium sp.]|uniref:ABC transporter permease subunit n=1 Tax=Microbacterium sp. TaxID=51671 RepID=UPI0039E59EA2
MSLDLLGVHLSLATALTGAIEGTGYALMAVGLLLVYRSTRVLNFAHAQVGVFGALVTAWLILEWQLPYWVGVVAGVAVGAAVSYLFQRIVMRPLASRPKVVLLIATLGLSQLVSAAGNLFPPLSHPGAYPAVSDAVFTFGDVTVSAAAVTMLAVVAVVTAALGIFLARSRYGLALLASSDNAEAARLAGIPVHRVGAVVFSLVGGLAALTVVLYNPVQGVAAGTGLASQGTSMLLMAFTAALAGGFWSLSRAAMAGVLLGILQAFLYANVSDPGTVSALLFVVLVIVVVATARRSRMGAEDAGAVVPATAPLPRALDLTRWSTRVRTATVVLIVAVGVAAPFAIGTSAGQLTLIQIICYALAALSVCVITGWTGQIALGQFAFVGIGAYLVALLVNHGWDVSLALVAAAVAGGVVAGLLGIPALRARGMYLAVLTLGFVTAVQAWLLPSALLNPAGQTLISVFGPHLLGLSLLDRRTYYFVCLAVLILVVLLLAGVARGASGRRLRAVRDNEVAAAATGISPAVQKVKAFALSGAVATVAGGLWGVGLGTFQASQFSADASITLVFMVVIGGVATLAGPVLAGVGVIGFPVVLGMFVNGLAGSIQNLITLLGAIGVLLAIKADPEGIGAGLRRLRGRVLRRLEAWRPSPARPEPAAPIGRVAPRPSGDQTLAVTGLSVRFGGIVANDDVSFTMAGATITGLIGTNGAGKSTLVNAISGAERRASGRITLGGVRLDRLPAHRRARLGVARTFQNARLFEGLTVSETLALAREADAPVSLAGDMLWWPRGLRRDARLRAESDALARSLGLEAWLDSLIADLSTGTRRVVELACVLSRRPSVILLDEPAAGLAQREVESLGALVRRIVHDTRAATLLVEHDLPFVMGASDEVVAMAQGRVIARGEPEAVRTDPAVVASYLGTDERAVLRSGGAAS